MLNLSTRILVVCALAGFAVAAISETKSTAANSGARGAAVFINGEPVRQSVIDLLMKKQYNGVPAATGIQQKVQDELVMETLLAQQATINKLATTPEVIDEMELARLATLSRAYLDYYFKVHPVNEDMVKTQYERARAAGEIKEYRVRHISVASQDVARELVKQLQSGADFAKLAKAKSTDPGANENGGDIGWFRPDTFVDEQFATAVTGLKKGEITREPVQTRWGWQIIKVEDGPRQLRNLPPYDQVDRELKDAMLQKMTKKSLDDLIASLKAKASITQDLASRR